MGLGAPWPVAVTAALGLDPLVGKQRRSVELAEARINIWEGSVRSSKTVCSLIAWLLFVRLGPAGNLAMIGKTERTLKRNVIDPLVEWLGPKRCRYVAGAGELWLLGRRIYVAGANNETAIGKIQGLTLVGAYVDEAALMPEGMWSMLLTRLSLPGARLFATTNPDSPVHWLLRDYLSRARLWLKMDGSVDPRCDHPSGPLDLVRLSFKVRDNPSLPPEYVAALEAEFSGLWYLRYIEGRWVLAEGVIWSMYDEKTHVVAHLPEFREYLVAVDYGTAGVLAAGLLGLGVDDRIYLISEWRWDAKVEQKQLTDAQYSAELRRWLDAQAEVHPGANRPFRIEVDPSAASFIIQLRTDGWSPVTGAYNDVADGLRRVASLLGGDRLRIHASCTGLRGEVPGYVWDPKALERDGKEQPVKANDHSCDMLRYGVMGAWSWWRYWSMVDEVPQAD